MNSEPKIKKDLLQLYRGKGYEVKTGDKFWNTNKGWGWEVGRYVHSCHIDSTEFVVLLFDNWLEDCCTKSYDSTFLEHITV